VHVGKTGGTTVHEQLKLIIRNYREYHHTKDYNNEEKYIIWIRNPISRFVSAFNHSYYGVNIDVNTIEKFDLDHCLIPYRMLNSKETPYVFSEKYDSLIRCFTNANHLAESLSSNDLVIKERAMELMKAEDEHLFKGIGWYLNRGNFVKNRNDRIIFVGKTETMNEDIDKLSTILNIKLNENLRVRENKYFDKSMKYLSPLAIKNIIEWYKDTDYVALEELHNYGWITKKTLDSYYEYNG
jgi:hypothetical protein